MKRTDLEHIIRAATALADRDEVLILGRASILGRFPDTPDSLTGACAEVSMLPYSAAHTDLINGSLGEGSLFQDAFGYYAQGVDPAALPDGWEARLIRIQGEGTNQRVGLCLDPHDLVAAMLAAGREEDQNFCRELSAQGLVKCLP